jgi:hypothetical protein
MNSSRTLLFTRPRHDLVTNYLFHWSSILIEQAQNKGHETIDLHTDKATRKNVVSRLRKNKPHFLHLNGHGSDTAVTGHNNEPVVDSDNAKNLNGVIVYARSCNSGAKLGEMCVSYGAKAYLGYNRAFKLPYMIDSVQRPLNDDAAAYALEPSNQVVVTLMKGHSVEDAYKRSQESSRRKINELLSGAAPEGASLYLLCVWNNMKSQVCIGDSSSRL